MDLEETYAALKALHDNGDITLCEAWADETLSGGDNSPSLGFLAFSDDMGTAPSAQHAVTFIGAPDHPWSPEWSPRTVAWQDYRNNSGLQHGKVLSKLRQRRIAKNGGKDIRRSVRKFVHPNTGALTN